MTVQETHFFRNAPQMEALRPRVLPELLRRAAGREAAADHLERRLLDRRGGLHARDAAPGAVADERTGGAAPRIVATDVSTEALRAARRGDLSRSQHRHAPPMVAASAGSKPRPGGGWVLPTRCAGSSSFRVHNLVADPPPFGPGEVDLVICRNVTIYFSRETTRSLIGGFHDVLAEGGYLLLGHSETLWQVSDAFTLVPMGDAFVYRRTADVRLPDAAESSKTPTSGTASGRASPYGRRSVLPSTTWLPRARRSPRGTTAKPRGRLRLRPRRIR